MKIIHFADLHLGVERYGHINPETGLSTRLEDFLKALDQVVDYAIDNDNSVDLVLFCGDAYKTREPTQTQQREFAKRINRLSTNDIPIFLLIGNHDLPNVVGRATATEIFDTLAVKNVYVSNKPELTCIPTKSGSVQIMSLPWLRRNTLLTKEETKNLTFEQLNQRMQEVLTNIIDTTIPKLDPVLPSILAAHVWVSTMAIGQEHALLISNVANPAFDYVALGHIHKYQALFQNPPVVYAGSLERLDFGEEEDDKGFCLIEITPEDETGKRQTSFAFHPLEGRRFLTININIESDDSDPTLTVLNMIHQGEISDAIIRLQINLPADCQGQLRDIDIRNALKETHYFTIIKDIKRETRLRLGKWTTEELTPVEVLKKYLETRKDLPQERAKLLLEYGEKMIHNQSFGEGH